RFAANDGESLQVSKIVLFLILARSTRFVTYPSLVSEDGAAAVFQDHGAVFQNLRLVSARFDFPAPVDQFRLRAASGRQPLYIYAIRYLEAAKSST
ncbi:hypothetical protein K0U00_51365, partial [Paenibacillus sepulcri]|nr:hypothetical protein [Paenibacillus sepulcri]